MKYTMNYVIGICLIAQIWASMNIFLNQPTSLVNYQIYTNKSVASNQTKTMDLKSNIRIHKDMDKEFHCITQCRSNCLAFVYNR